MTLKNNRTPLLSNITLFASFYHHISIQTGITVRKRLRWVLTFVTLTFDLWPLTLSFCMDITFVNSHNSRKFHDDMMRGTLWKKCHRRTDRQTDRRTDGLRAAWSQLKIRRREIRISVMHSLILNWPVSRNDSIYLGQYISITHK